METLTIKQVEEKTGNEKIDMYGIKTEEKLTYEFVLDFNDSNFGKKKGWIKDEGAKWNPTDKKWVLTTNHIPRHLIDMISKIY